MHMRYCIVIKEEAINNKIFDLISREAMRIILKGHVLNSWQQKNYSVPDLNDEFIERMEDVLSLIFY